MIKKLNFNVKDAYNQNLLHYAAQTDDIKIINLLLGKNIDKNV